MSSITIPNRVGFYAADPLPQKKVNSSNLDTDTSSFFEFMSQAKDLFDILLRDDDQIRDGVVRFFSLNPEVLTILNLQNGWNLKVQARVAATGHVNINNPGTDVFDNVEMTNGDRVLLANQSSSWMNGIYQFNGSGVAMTRTTDANTGALLLRAYVAVSEGDTQGGTGWQMNAEEEPTIDVDPVTFAKVLVGGSGGSSGVTAAGTHVVRSIAERFADAHNARDYGAIADGDHHLLSADDAAMMNARYGVYGLNVAAGDEMDRAACLAAMYHAANTGRPIHLPIGTYLTASPLTLNWTGTPISGQPNHPKVTRMFGDGNQTIIKGTIATAGRAVLELLGTDNGNAVNIELSHMTIKMSGGDPGAYCLRIGDCWGWTKGYRLECEGANGCLLKVASSVSYANLNTHFEQCNFWSNYGMEWFADDDDATVFSLKVETDGSYWDNVRFSSCLFHGLCLPRAFIVEFDNCQFFVNPGRTPDFAYPYNVNLFVTLGTLKVDNCYFEDHDIAIQAAPYTADIRGITITNSHFTGATNFVGKSCSRAISIYTGPNGSVGPVIIEGNKIGCHWYTQESIDVYGIHGRVAYNTNIAYIGVPITLRQQFCNLEFRDTVWNEFGSLICERYSTDYRDRIQRLTVESTDLDAVQIAGGVACDGIVTSIQFVTKRIGDGDTAGFLWGHGIDNAGGTDRVIIGWSSLAYTPTGAVPWIPDDSPVMYLPTGSVFHIGFGSATLSHQISDGVIASSGGFWGSQDTPALVGTVPQWFELAIDYTYFSGIAATSGNAVLFSLPAGVMVLATIPKHTTSFSGGTVSACTAQVGIVGTPAKYAAAFDVHQAPGSTKFAVNQLAGMEDFGAGADVVVTLTATGGNLNTLTSGLLKVKMLLARVPS